MIEEIRETLLKFYYESGRKFPWRGISDIYKLVVTEILLKRTNAQKVDEVWNSFFQTFPNSRKLSEATSEQIEAVIAPLGLQRNRSRELRRIALELAEHRDYTELLNIPSIGQYIAGSVSIQMEKPWQKPPVDVNIERVISRLLGIPKFNQKALKFYNSLYSPGVHIEILYAILDLAALLCRPNNPKCNKCPLEKYCGFPRRRISPLCSSKYIGDSVMVVVLSRAQYDSLKNDGELLLPSFMKRNRTAIVYVKVPTKSFVGTVSMKKVGDGIIIHTLTPFEVMIPLQVMRNLFNPMILRAPYTWIAPRRRFNRAVHSLGQA